METAAPRAVLALQFLCQAPVLQAFALACNVGLHGLKGGNECNLVLHGLRASHLSDQELITSLGHCEHGLRLALFVDVEGLPEVEESPCPGLGHALANQPDHMIMALTMHGGHLQRVGYQPIAISMDEL